jgi:hypothetical protein
MTRHTPAASVFLVLSKEDRAVNTTPVSRTASAREESGFALILAILALLLLTFLGLTVATSTSTELQIATNYRWGQQALYNAEAGLEAAKIILSTPGLVSQTNGLEKILPAERSPGAHWSLNQLVPPLEATAGRDFENGVASGGIGCDRRGGGMGYGRILVDDINTVPPDNDPVRYENINTWGGQPINGTFTIWVRRELQQDDTAQFFDSPEKFVAVVTVEGTAPYVDNTSAFTQANQSVRVLETTLVLNQSQGITSCSGLEGQAGMSPQGDNFGCAMLDDSSVGALQ